MQVDLSSNYFELFALQEKFEIDEVQLVRRFRELQRMTHPDKFASASDAEKRWSVQAAAHINSAEQTLSKPLSRAIYLLQRRDVDLAVETDTRMAPEFLMMQMELRESIESLETAADPYTAAQAARKEVDQHIEQTSEAFRISFQLEELSTAREKAREWQFLDKLLAEIRDTEERLDSDY